MQCWRHFHGQLRQAEELVEELVDVGVLFCGGFDVGAAGHRRDERQHRGGGHTAPATHGEHLLDTPKRHTIIALQRSSLPEYHVVKHRLSGIDF